MTNNPISVRTYLTTPAWALGGCCARIGGTFPAGSPRKGARCENPALFPYNVEIEGDNFVMGLCGMHSRVIRNSARPLILARSWALDVPLVAS